MLEYNWEVQFTLILYDSKSGGSEIQNKTIFAVFMALSSSYPVLSRH